MLSALYYPFSRCIDISALKQLLLVFDSVTFLDPVDDDERRAKLFRDLEQQEDKRFINYRNLYHPLKDLRNEGAIVLCKPEKLAVFHSPLVVASTLSDLLDAQWCAVASRPELFNLPHGNLDSQGRVPWQTFPSKLPPLFQEALLNEETLKEHLLMKGMYGASWTLSYEAGSAAALNLHVSAASELSLAPVTDSVLHNRLLLRKLTRSITDEPNWTKPDHFSIETSIAHQTAVHLVQELLPRSSLINISFDSILEFREQTKAARIALIKDLANRISRISKIDDPGEILAAQRDISQTVSDELKIYRAELANARDQLWPNLVGSMTIGGVATGTLAAIVLEFLAGGPLGVISGSIGGAALSLLKSTLNYRAEVKKLERNLSPAIAYLSQIIDR